jgi:hypothetical protein
MMKDLTTTAPDTSKRLFSAYKVNDVLLSNTDFAKYKQPSFASSNVIYKNSSFTILSFNIK